MSELHIRAARFEDWPTIADFNCQLALETEHKQLNLDKIQPGVQALLQDANKGRYFVAEDGVGGPIVGQLMHTYEWSDWRNGPIWWMQSVYVTEEFRKRGVFRALYEHLMKLAEAEKVLGVRLYVERDNVRAQQSYQNLGLNSAGYLVLERWLGPSL